MLLFASLVILLPFTARVSGSEALSNYRRTFSLVAISLSLHAASQLAVVSNIATIVLSIVSYMRHILYLEDPRDPEVSGSAHKHHHHFRRHKKRADDTGEEEA